MARAGKVSKTVDPRANGFQKVPLPPDLQREIPLLDNARTVLRKRYLRRGADGQPVENEQEMFWRVAYHVAKAEAAYGENVEAAARRYYDLLTGLNFFPNSPTFTGAGTPLGQLAACFVLPIDDDMGRTGSGIFETLRDAALIQQTGGGNGFAFSRLRPKGAVVRSSNGKATGPVGFLRVYDQAFGEIAQGGSRRGANMAVLNVSHPDIREFITCKTDENQITNFNISVGITDDFMRAVEQDGDFDLINPRDGQVWETVRARDLFDMIVKQAHYNGEPGVLFLDAANRDNPVSNLYTLESTNPCGEQFLGPYENCCLGSINLANHMTDDGQVDWEHLRKSIETATCFLDDVVSSNAYVPAVPELEEAAHRVRRIGLGIMGLADMMYSLGVRYGSVEGQEFASQVMEFVRFHSMRTSVELSRLHGPFLAIEGSIYDPNDLQWQPPAPIVDYVHDWGRPVLDWAEIVDGIRQYGIRNGAQTTVAPTGTISTVAGCEGYGCEPVFALAYMRYVNDQGQRLTLQYTSPLFERALRNAGLDDETIQRVVEQVNESGTCQTIDEVPEHIRRVFVVSSDVSAEEHVRMQAALQAFTDNAISKTCNFPEGATEQDVADAYLLGWRLGCKGLTVYVTGSRETVVLETAETARKKQDDLPAPIDIDSTPVIQTTLFAETKKPRPRSLTGRTYRVDTPLGGTYVTVNENGHGEGHPFEVFLHTAKAGSETAAVSEALGRLVSYVLRLASPVTSRDRLKEVVRQLSGIGGGRAIGFGPARVGSLPDGIAQVLQEYLDETSEAAGDGEAAHVISDKQLALPMKLGDLCPECGAATLVNEEGCRKCYSCGFSEC
ncbi:adenosylcobalamin-dependent ribonucleoside-diphosphate reductase [Aggregatilinea lenta]|uniref:adenosylcobalamin-dependent ribonucleoside-diphosphate reductase n=1 Tax=Aggregatilinea lenta TaxID=913108 RepID=UPI000E5AA5C3|nr:adenosylcobalamin-dependent ribonucleoside-diphosphate reductase [Aggregatilinea lenta]